MAVEWEVGCLGPCLAVGIKVVITAIPQLPETPWRGRPASPSASWVAQWPALTGPWLSVGSEWTGRAQHAPSWEMPWPLSHDAQKFALAKGCLLFARHWLFHVCLFTQHRHPPGGPLSRAHLVSGDAETELGPVLGYCAYCIGLRGCGPGVFGLQADPSSCWLTSLSLGPGYSSGSRHGRSPVAGHSVCAETQDRPVGGLLCRPVWGPDLVPPLPGSCGPVAVPVLASGPASASVPRTGEALPGGAAGHWHPLRPPLWGLYHLHLPACERRLPEAPWWGCRRHPRQLPGWPSDQHWPACGCPRAASGLAEPSRHPAERCPDPVSRCPEVRLGQGGGVPGEWGSHPAGPASPSLPGRHLGTGCGGQARLGALRRPHELAGRLQLGGSSGGLRGLCLLHRLSHSRPGSLAGPPHGLPVCSLCPGRGGILREGSVGQPGPSQSAGPAGAETLHAQRERHSQTLVPHQTPALHSPPGLSAADVAGSARPQRLLRALWPGRFQPRQVPLAVDSGKPTAQCQQTCRLWGLTAQFLPQPTIYDLSHLGHVPLWIWALVPLL